MGKLVIDGNSVYELDEVCIRKKDDEERRHKENQERKEDKEKKRKQKIKREMRICLSVDIFAKTTI